MTVILSGPRPTADAQPPESGVADRDSRHALMAAGRSVEVLRELGTRPPENTDPETGFDLSVAEWNAGRWTEAVERATSLVQRSPQDARAAHALGWVLFQRGEIRRARANAQKALDLDPQEPRHVALIAAIELASGRVAEAESAANKLVSLLPCAAAPHELLGHVAARRSRWRLAAGHFGRALELDEYARDALLSRAEVSERDGQIREACNDLLRAAKTEPSMLATHVATLVDRTLGIGHGVLAVTIFWALTGMPGMLHLPAAQLAAELCLLTAAAIAFVWHRRRLRQVPEDAMTTYRKVRVVVHVFVALMASMIALFVVGLLVGRLVPHVVDMSLLGTLIVTGAVLVTAVALAIPDIWRAYRGISVKPASLLAF